MEVQNKKILIAKRGDVTFKFWSMALAVKLILTWDLSQAKDKISIRSNIYRAIKTGKKAYGFYWVEKQISIEDVP